MAWKFLQLNELISTQERRFAGSKCLLVVILQPIRSPHRLTPGTCYNDSEPVLSQLPISASVDTSSRRFHGLQQPMDDRGAYPKLDNIHRSHKKVRNSR